MSYLQRDHRAWVQVDPDALAHNVRLIKQYLAPAQLLAVVKADAYGHGAITVSETVSALGVKWLGVATIDEGIQLREAGLQGPILLMGATNSPAEVRAVAHWRLQPTLCTPRQALTYAETLTQPLAVQLKIDTGMTRLGTPWQEGLDFLRLVHHLPGLQVAGLYSHLAMTNFASGVGVQVQRFEKLLEQARAQQLAPPLVHLANSAGTLLGLHYDLARVGLLLYGHSPVPTSLPLRPVLSLKARITQVHREVPVGTGVSYGHLFITQRESTLATVALGYADGLPRHLSGQIEVLVNGQRAPQVGAITMDQCTIDVTGLAPINEGDIVTFLGEDLPVTDWADKLQTISYEVLCGFKHRLPRLVKASVIS